MATTATNHWKLGLFVVSAIAAMIGAAFWVGAHRFQRETFQALSYFDESVQGLNVGSPVKWRGVTIGTVSDLTVAPDRRHVQVTADIFVDSWKRLGLALPKRGEDFIDPNLRIQLASSGITGIRFLQIDFFDPGRHPPPHLPFEAPWNYVPSTPSTLKNVEDLAIETLNKLPTVEDQINGALVDARKTMASVDALATLLSKDDGAFHNLLVQLRSTASRLDRSIQEAQLGSTTAALRSTSGRVGDAAAGVSDVRSELASSLVALRETLEAVRALADSLDRDPSALVRGPRADAPRPKGP